MNRCIVLTLAENIGPYAYHIGIVVQEIRVVVMKVEPHNVVQLVTDKWFELQKSLQNSLSRVP